MIRIALIEDDLPTATLMLRQLTDEGFIAERFTDGREAIQSLRKKTFDLLIVDWELPIIRGNEVIDWVRQNLGDVMPIMLVTQRGAECDVVEGLRNGADEFLTKPVQKEEFLARIRALLRRSSNDMERASSFNVGRYLIDIERSEIQVSGEPVMLTPREFQVAAYLFRNRSRLVTCDEIVSTIWEHELSPLSRTFDTHIAKIKKKLRLGPENGVRLVRVYSLGCRLEETH